MEIKYNIMTFGDKYRLGLRPTIKNICSNEIRVGQNGCPRIHSGVARTGLFYILMLAESAHLIFYILSECESKKNAPKLYGGVITLN